MTSLRGSCFCHCRWSTFVPRAAVVFCDYCQRGIACVGGIFNFVIGDCERDYEQRFFGDDPVIQVIGRVDHGDLAMIARVFDSKSDARRAGCSGELRGGYYEFRTGKPRKLFRILDTTEWT